MGIKNFKGVSIRPDDVETNIVIFDISGAACRPQADRGNEERERFLSTPLERPKSVSSPIWMSPGKEDIETALRYS
jgi:hypothetical protein